LTKDQDKRPTAEAALLHPWIQEATAAMKKNVGADVAQSALLNLSNFNANSKLK